MRVYPAIDVRPGSATDLLLGILDDYQPTAIDEQGDRWRVFFSTADTRDAAVARLDASHFPAAAIDIDDGDWARRSQEGLGPVTVGRMTIAPPWAQAGLKACATTAEESPAPSPQPPVPSLQSSVSSPGPPVPGPQPLLVIIEPSMGFGTGHHATTRLCLAALQAIDLTGRSVLDVGTGSGVLAIAADRLGAARVLGIDSDADAIQSARDNLVLNPKARHVEVREADLTAADLPPSDVATANLTGALLEREASRLRRAVRPGGYLIVSGLLAEEQATVTEAFMPAVVEWQGREDEWIGLAFRLPQ